MRYETRYSEACMAYMVYESRGLFCRPVTKPMTFQQAEIRRRYKEFKASSKEAK